MKPIIYIFLLMLFCIPVMAEENATTNITADNSRVIVQYPDDMLENVTVNNASETVVQYSTKEINTTKIGRRIEQGGCVVPGETIDIAGIGWYTGTISYYGMYYDDYSEANNVSIKAVYHPEGRELPHLYLDPQFFGSRLGYWYVMYDTSGGSGNDRLFRVSKSCAPSKKDNATILSEQFNETTALIAFAKNKTVLPVRTDGGIDYIFSRPSITTMDAPNDTVSRWIFGRENSDKFYDTPIINGKDTFDVQDLTPGDYSVVYIVAGKNGEKEEIYDRTHKSITSPFKNSHDTPLYGIEPRVAETLLGYAVGNSKDDTKITKRISVQDPMIDVVKLSQNSVKLGSNNVTVFTLSGYTNANQGTAVSIQLDGNYSVSGKLSVKPWTADVVNNGGQVAYRAWAKSFLLDTGSMSKGDHFFTITNSEGASAVVPFYNYKEPVAHYKPDVDVNYIGNSPFLPTPAPKIVKEKVIVTQKVIERITIPVTPSQESVDAATWSAVIGVIMLAVFGIIAIAILGYMIVVGLRVAYLRRKQ